MYGSKAGPLWLCLTKVKAELLMYSGTDFTVVSIGEVRLPESLGVSILGTTNGSAKIVLPAARRLSANCPSVST